MLLFLFSSSLFPLCLNNWVHLVASVWLTGLSKSNMLRFGLILAKMLQFSIGTFLQTQVDICYLVILDDVQEGY